MPESPVYTGWLARWGPILGYGLGALALANLGLDAASGAGALQLGLDALFAAILFAAAENIRRHRAPDPGP